MKKNNCILNGLCFLFLALQITNLSAQTCFVCPGNTGTTGSKASAFGTNNSATGLNSITFGNGNIANSENAISFGYQSEALGTTAVAFGYKAKANGTRGVSIGENSYSVSQAYSFGQYAKANISQSIAIGRFVETNASGAIVLGSSISGYSMINNKPNSLMVGFNSTQPTLFVGPALSYSGYGKVGIATNNPLQELHVNGNILLTGSNSTLLFADTPPTNGNWGKFGIEYETNGLNFWKPYEQEKPDISASEAKGNAQNYILFLKDDGNIGVGTNDPREKLDIDGNIRLRNNAIIGTWSNNSLTFKTNSLARMTIGANGNVAIGNTTDPKALLHILAEGSQDASILLESTGTGKAGGIFFRGSAVNIGTLDKDQPIAFYTAGTELRMKIDPEGNVGIGVESPQYKLHVAGNAKFNNQVVIDAGGLYVNGEIKAKKYLATLTPFPDYVFLPEYKLLTINEVESYIAENGHLPGLPDAATVEKNGIELGEMNALLLQKIEELTLYIIAQDKKIQALETVVISQK